jgi:DNA-binding MarR family transcriptional regulator
MSIKAPQNIDRQALLDKLSDLGRVSSTQTVFLHQVIAQSVGLNATDTKCVDLILRAPSGILTHGQLSLMTGLTTGAITHIVDRLERLGFVKRQRGQTDRRKVYLRVVPKSLTPLLPKYELVGRRHQKLLEDYTTEQLLLIIDYLEKPGEVSAKILEEMISLNREPKSKAR